MPAFDPVTERAGSRIAKDALRAMVRSQRAAIADRAANDAARTELLLSALGDWRPACVAAYVSTSDEPGTADLLDALAAWATVLLPVLSPTAAGPRRDPDWATYEGRERLRPGLWGIGEPTSASLGAEAVNRADLVFLPGLAATPAGDRLGTGGGWYDRALSSVTAPRWLLLHDDEVLESVPVDPWDLPVSVIVTERRVIRCG